MSTSRLKIKPYFVVGWTVKLALRLLAGHGVLVSRALAEEGRIKIADIVAFIAAGCEVVIDNGEFSRWKSGRPTNGDAYYEWLRSLDAAGASWLWAVALDVIGDAKGTRENWRKAQKEHADLLPRLVPVFHEGDPWDLLEEYDPERRLVALGRTDGRGSKRKTLEWYDECFNRHPDMRPHFLGNASPATIEGYPAKSFDASTWERNATYSNAHGWPFNRCSKELRMRAHIEACETMEHRPAAQLRLGLTSGEPTQACNVDAGEVTMTDALAKANGFDDWDDMAEHAASVLIDTPERLAAFKTWQEKDGTKAGLLKLPRREDGR